MTRRWPGGAGVHAMSLDIPAGSFVTLLGPSGCGKSTTLRLIAGLEAPDSGRLFINGEDVTGISPDRRHLSMVFQSYALFPHLDVAENILFGLKVRRVPRPERAERLSRALALTGLEGLEQRRPGQLSGGQRQRVALARAIVADHPLCLMDEPLSNLDAKLRHSVRREIRALQKRLGMTVIYVTHDQTEAMSMADSVVLMKDGLIEQQGSPASLYNKPASTFAAGFIGQPPMALIPAEMLFPAHPKAHERLAGLRPEQVALAAPGTAARAEAVIGDCEYLGGETFATVHLSGDDDARLFLKIAGEFVPEPGRRVFLTWPDNALHLFDRQSGRRLACPADLAGSSSPFDLAGQMTSNEVSTH
ncbi:ABC transporter ATP-binding protein [Martelella lutilitoris]|uniref:ABC transporter ATP-binding protein n=2 Tax=Martelella lutilitoris TaxID=2583532 RepID=A0A5C4JQW9_9HYPH|nr:ABC transporter ATP-binding protein [Martelella lutilitoris]TNB47753.1 ABC transporter ATP-binding protein [Martelella lutilitoris]